jgi:hypothetical protein
VEAHRPFTGRCNLGPGKTFLSVKSPLGQPLPDISTTAAFREALVKATSVGYSKGASGTHCIEVVLPRPGLTEVMAANGYWVLSRRFVGEEVAEGSVSCVFSSAANCSWN